MSDRRTKNSKCIFCGIAFGSAGQDSRRTKEHYWGSWLQSYLRTRNDKRRPHYETLDWNGQVPPDPKGFFARGGHPLASTVPDLVCQQCNNGWMSTVQEQAKQAFLGSSAFFAVVPVVRRLNLTMRSALTDWIALKAILHGHQYNLRRHLTHNEIQFAFKPASDWAKRYLNGQFLPDNWVVYYCGVLSDRNNPCIANYSNIIALELGASSKVKELFFCFHLVYDMCFVTTNVQSIELAIALARVGFVAISRPPNFEGTDVFRQPHIVEELTFDAWATFIDTNSVGGKRSPIRLSLNSRKLV